MKTALIQILMAFLGSVGFAGLFHVRRDRLMPAAIGGAVAWTVLLLAQHFISPDTFFVNFVAAAAGVLYAEIMARICRAPTTVFIVISIVPMVPGGGIYYTMAAFVQKNAAEFAARGSGALMAALGLAAGIVFTTVLFRAIPQKTLAKLYRVRKPKEVPHGRS